MVGLRDVSLALRVMVGVLTVGASGVQASISVDFNSGTAPTQAGFEGISATNTDLGDSWSRLLGSGVGVDVDAVGSSTLDHRDRGASNGGGTANDMFRDFVFGLMSNGPSTGLDLKLTGLTPGKLYPVTIWSWDTLSGTPRSSDWYTNDGGGSFIHKTSYTFDGAGTDPAGLNDRRFTVHGLTDGSGALTVRGLAQATGQDHNVFANGLEIGDPVSTHFKIDIDSSHLSTSIHTAPGWTSLDATTGDGSTVTQTGVTFTVYSADGSRLRTSGGVPVPDALLSDFVFDDGAGQAVGLHVDGLPAGKWLARVWAWDATATNISQIIGMVQGTGPEQIFGNNIATSATTPFEFTFESDGVSRHSIFAREFNEDRSRLSALELIYVVPEPATAVLLAIPLLMRRFRRA